MTDLSQRLDVLELAIISLSARVYMPFEEERDAQGRWTAVGSAELENHNGTANKFYKSEVYKDENGKGVHVRTYGSLKPGAAASTIIDRHPTVNAAQQAHNDLVSGKIRGGYTQTNAPAPRGTDGRGGPEAAAAREAAGAYGPHPYDGKSPYTGDGNIGRNSSAAPVRGAGVINPAMPSVDEKNGFTHEEGKTSYTVVQNNGYSGKDENGTVRAIANIGPSSNQVGDTIHLKSDETRRPMTGDTGATVIGIRHSNGDIEGEVPNRKISQVVYK
jgi:hypothetical protein